MQAFEPETFWYISIAIEREDEDDPAAAPRLVEFKWKRNHLFDEDVVRMLYEQVEEAGQATVEKVETKPTTKWYASCIVPPHGSLARVRLLRCNENRA